MHASIIEADKQGGFIQRQQRMICGGGGVCDVQTEKAAYLGFELDPVLSEKHQQVRKLRMTRLLDTTGSQLLADKTTRKF